MPPFAEKKGALIGTSQYKVELKKVLKSPLLENPDSDGKKINFMIFS